MKRFQARSLYGRKSRRRRMEGEVGSRGGRGLKRWKLRVKKEEEKNLSKND